MRAKRAQKGSNDLSTIHPIDTRALPGYLKREGVVGETVGFPTYKIDSNRHYNCILI
jgi:hypothetical protein